VDLLAKKALSGVHDSRSPWYASSVEMVTSPETYPIWRTKRPVVLVLPDKEKKGAKNEDEIGEMMDVGENSENQPPGETSGVYHHHYRYLVTTPGAETSGAHGLFDSGSNGEMEDIKSMLNRTKISVASLRQVGAVGGGGFTSNDLGNVQGTGSNWPVTLWENPFLPAEEDNMDAEITDNAGSTVSLYSSALSLYSDNNSVKQAKNAENSGVHKDFALANLPYRTLDIDIATASVIKSPSYSEMDDSSINLEYTEDGILIDNWNARDDITHRHFLLREKLKTDIQRHDSEMTTSTSGGSINALDSMIVNTQGKKIKKRRIYIVCYHLPVIVSKDGSTGKWQACWSESLLAKTENSSFVSAFDPHWVGTVTTGGPINDTDKAALRELLAEMNCTVLFFDKAVRDSHYEGYCKQVLWLAFHHVDELDMLNPAFAFDLDSASDGTPQGASNEGLMELRSFWDQRHISKWWEAYNIVNRTFAVEVAQMVHHEDVVWVHDYHLSLLPRILGEEEKKLRPRVCKKIFYLHIPFPVSMIFKEMECGEAVLEGILHADVVGFHGFTDARHFLSSSKRILGLSHESLEGGLIGVKYKGKTVVVTMSSVSIEPHIVDAAMHLPSSVNGVKEMTTKHAGRMIIAGVDVAQYLSGIGLKLHAYEQLLVDSPSWREKVVLVQRCLIPGARRLDEARTIKEIRMIVKRIRMKFGEGVIDYGEVYGSSMPIDQRLALWRASDILLNTEVRGGFHQWPLEFVYAQKDSNVPGIVIASEFSAVFGILNGALRICPFDLKHTIATIDRALTMSKEERQGRHIRDIEFVSSSSSDKWIQNVLRDLRDQVLDDQKGKQDEAKKKKDPKLESVAGYLANEREENFSYLDAGAVISAYKATSRRVFILDFNGTIVIKEAVDSFLKRDSIGSSGDAPPLDVIQSLEKICSDPQNTVFVVSGDQKEKVEEALGNIRNLGLAASNGSCFSPPLIEGETERNWLALNLGVDWDSVKQVAIPIMSKFTARTNGSFIKVAHSSIGWSYYSCDPEFGSLQAKYLVIELERELEAFDVRFVNLKGIVEVVPRRLHKGIVVKKILRHVAAQDNNAGLDFILCMGDDVSDEKMFTSVFSFLSETDEDYINVVPSPPVVPVEGYTLPKSHTFVEEVPIVRCRNLNHPTYAFTVAVGKKPSHATQYVDDAIDVADLLVKIAKGSAQSRRWSRANTEENMFT